MSEAQQGKRKMADESELPRKQPKLSDSLKYAPRPQSSTQISTSNINSSRTYTARKVMDLNAMTTAERERHYEALFSNKVEPIHVLDFPPLATEYPNFATEIHAAYLRHTTFIVKVWVNYDHAVERFFYDDRTQDCGILRLRQKQIDRYLKPYEFGKIRLELRTPFTYLTKITIHVESNKIKVGPQIAAVRHRNIVDTSSLFYDTVHNVCCGIYQQYDVTGQKGLNHDDILALAKSFLIKPNAED